MESEIENKWKELISSFVNVHPTYHIVFEILLFVSVLFLYYSRSYKPTEVVKLTKKEEEELISDWVPEPLIPKSWIPNDEIQSKFIKCANSGLSKYVEFGSDKHSKEVLNLATLNFFNLIGNREINDEAQRALKKYGVGSCGPRGFYGTFDVHLQLEDEIAKFIGCEEAVVYSYGFSTVASAIPAYAKRGDIIFADEGVSFAIQCGILASRSKVQYFRHNDMDHLVELLDEQMRDAIKNPAKAKVTRLFIIVEGLYINYGDICPLPRLIELKYRYKFRIFLDESISFGVLGDFGRGVVEYFNVNADDIDMITGSFETSLASCGGFSAGSQYVVDHQRLSGQGYCFSASLPPLLACGTSIALKIVKGPQGQNGRLRLTEISEQVTEAFAGKLSKYWQLNGSVESPIKHLRLKSQNSLERLELAAKLAFDKGILITVARYLQNEEHRCPEPSIRLALNCDLSTDEIDLFAKTMESVGQALG